MSTKKRKKEHHKNATRAGSMVSASSFKILKLQDEGVSCAACGKYVSFVEVRHVLEHCFGSQLVGEVPILSSSSSRLKASTIDLMMLDMMRRWKRVHCACTTNEYASMRPEGPPLRRF